MNNEAVARVLGKRPRIEWIVSKDGGKSYRMVFNFQSEAETWLEKEHARGLHLDCAIHKVEIYPDFYSDDAAAVRDVLPWLIKHPQVQELTLINNSGIEWFVYLSHEASTNTHSFAKGKTLGEALCNTVTTLESPTP